MRPEIEIVEMSFESFRFIPWHYRWMEIQMRDSVLIECFFFIYASLHVRLLLFSIHRKARFR